MPFLSIFIPEFPHAFSVFDLFCSPNGMTAEPEYYRREAKAKERMGGKSLSGCRLELVRSLGRANFHIWKLASPNDSTTTTLKLCKFENQIKFSGFPLRQTVVTNISRFLAEIKIRLFKASVQFLCTAVGFTSS